MKFIDAPNTPAAVGPYSKAVAHGGLLFCSGQIPLDPETMDVIGTTIEEQTQQVMKNITALLEGAGAGLDQIIKTTVFIKDMDDFAAMNGVYEAALNGHKPARSAVEVSRLPKDVLVEIECIVALS